MSRSIAQVGLLPNVHEVIRSYFAVPSDLSRSGAQLFLLGAALAAIRHLTNLTLSLLDRTFISRCDLDSRDPAYAWFKALLGDRQGAKALHFTVSAPRNEDQQDLLWIPGPGHHILWFQRWPVKVTRSVVGDARSMRQSLSNDPSERLESISLSTVARDPGLLHELIESARRTYLAKDSSRTVVFTGTQYGGWQRLHARPIRPLSTVILAPELLDPLIDDIKNYLSPETERWYAERGIPYRRGYLFSGPPGTGKTSLAVALAGRFKLGVYMVSLAGKMNDETLLELLGNMPRRSILLLEDIDVAFPDRAVSREVGNVTASGLLNALDGVAAQEGRIVILTTNYKERLDAALIRPGRIDWSIEFKLASQQDCEALFTNFFGVGVDRALAEDFGRRCGGERFSIAALQGFLMMYKNTPKLALDKVESWKKVSTNAPRP